MERFRPWVVLILVVSAASFVLLALRSDGSDPWLFGVALFQGVLAALIVWREKETHSSAWHRLKQPPREGL